MQKFIVPIPNSAGYATDIIGHVFAYASSLKVGGAPAQFELHADERFQAMVADGAESWRVDVSVAYPYKRTDIPGSAEVTPAQQAIVEQLSQQSGASVITNAEIVQKLHANGPEFYKLIPSPSPAGMLLAKPISWFDPSDDKYESMIARLIQAASAGRQEAGLPPDAPATFLFFFGGKSLTDSEANAGAKKLGGMVKSVWAEDHIPGIAAFQKEAAQRGEAIIPVFALHGNAVQLQERIDEFNQQGLAPQATNLGIDWNNFEEPATAFLIAGLHHKAIILGNGSTPHHLALSVNDDTSPAKIIIMRPSWKNMPGESRWDGAEDAGAVKIVSAGFSYEQIMELLKPDSLTQQGPAIANQLIRDSSRNICQETYAQLIAELGPPHPQPKSSPVAVPTHTP
ncbi:MAG: hypothetical protein WDO70_12370 [Alphaproteobacteria bacterium]